MKICTIEGCSSRVNALDLCHRHYRRFRLYGDPEAPSRVGPKGLPSAASPCSFLGCSTVGKVTKGYCPTHYMRLLRHGDATVVFPSGNPGKGRVKHPLYRAWSQMINRCHNPNNTSYPSYGARGIVVCTRWQTDFLNFLADMGERPEGTSLDRIDPDGNYEPGNCRWADTKTQRANLSATGEQRMRQGLRQSKTEYWRQWRADRGLPPEAPTKAEYRARQKAKGSC